MYESVSHSVMSNSLQPHEPQHAGLPVHHQLAIQPSLSPPSPPAFNLSQHQGLFCRVSITWPKYWSFSFSISPSNEYSGLISFRIDWFDLAIEGILKSLFQHHSFKSINSSALSFLYSSTLTSIHDYWRNHSFD